MDKHVSPGRWSPLCIQLSHMNRKSSYPDYTTVLNLEGTEFPIILKQITKFELLNDISTCLHYFHTSEKLSLHILNCTTTNDCAIILPNENDKWLSFRGHNKKERLLFVVYADLECILEKKTNDENISRFTYQHHKVFSVGYYIRCVYDETMSIYKSYRGEDCVSWFVKELYDLVHHAKTIFDKNLTDETASDDDYQHATNVWRRFCIETLGNYNDLYLKTDVLLLVDVFENFRDTCIERYGLDPTYYYTLPGYTWDALKYTMLKYTGIRFELLTDIDMIRASYNNNKYNAFSYDPSESSTYLMYFDVNNLYGWAMSESLSYGEFQWVDDIERFDVMSMSSDSVVGYILEVDLVYPQSVHDTNADLPFCPIRERPPGKRNDKLLATLYNKRYVVYYRNLQQCIQHGLYIKKIHRILRFAQSPWLHGYIELNTRFRMLANNEFEKNLYKLMNNADGRYGAEAIIAKPNFHSRSIFSENLFAIELHKLEVKLNNILSLIYLLECENVYEDIKRDIARFDTNDYPKRNAYDISRVNNKIPDLMKDENGGGIMTEFIELRAKIYALRVIGKSDTKRIKGVKKNVIENDHFRRLCVMFERCNDTVETSVVYTIDIARGLYSV
ncbi:PREDICTED: uncharacterized protein LOC105154849 [Acromyrmex echinatior]|uniref:uncharacterized protein LOC105154849 n=1 Tax=Acromyrmex echinatior TaxID=103372 RepID=UPI00058107FC|nr:PREDICTED: uncharacterized protein LOC105154849 [Acromyrmex echinatior]